MVSGVPVVCTVRSFAVNTINSEPSSHAYSSHPSKLTHNFWHYTRKTLQCSCLSSRVVEVPPCTASYQTQVHFQSPYCERVFDRGVSGVIGFLEAKLPLISTIIPRCGGPSPVTSPPGSSVLDAGAGSFCPFL